MNTIGEKIKLWHHCCDDGIYRECCPFCGSSNFVIKDFLIHYGCGLWVAYSEEPLTYVIRRPCDTVPFATYYPTLMLDRLDNVAMAHYVEHLLSMKIGSGS